MLHAPVWLPALCALEPTGLHSQNQNSCPNGALPSRGKCAGQARAPHQGMPSEVSTARALRTCDGRPCSISGRAQIPDQSLHLPGTPPALRPALSLKGPSAHLPGLISPLHNLLEGTRHILAQTISPEGSQRPACFMGGKWIRYHLTEARTSPRRRLTSSSSVLSCSWSASAARQ